ncbi:MAG TPA: hypothetical protein VIH57_01535 [Bacteroidales bacterium]
MNKKNIPMIFLLVLLVLLVTSCVPGGGSHSPKNLAGFFSGVWHGWIAPVSLVWGFFESNIRIYEVYNTGWWYDLGFYISIIAGFGGISFIRKKSKSQ